MGSRRYAPGAKLMLVKASGPTGGTMEVLVSGDRRVYYKRYCSYGNYERIPMWKAREFVEKMERDCNEVPERPHQLDEDLVQELRNRTEDPVPEPVAPRMTNWGRQVLHQENPGSLLGLPA